MTTFDLGDTIRFEHRGEIRSGRIVGTEEGRNRYGCPAGTLYFVALDGSWIEVHETMIRDTPLG